MVAALTYCLGVRVALWTLPSATTLRYVHRRVTRARSAPAGAAPIPRIAWAVRAAGRRVPWNTCLVEALSAQLFLAHHGQPSDLRVGVGRSSAKAFVAHAWVEVDGRVVVGGDRDMRYAPLPDFRQLLD